MKLETPCKTVMFYGNAMHVNASANWMAVNKDGTMTAFLEKPYISHGVWDVKSEQIWNLDARAELEGKNWKDTLTHCPHDQQWMIEAAAILIVAAASNDPHVPDSMGEQLTDIIASRMKMEAEDTDDLQEAFHAFLTHGFPCFMHKYRVVDILRDRLFPKPEKPEYRVVKDYYGRDVVVPPQTRWIAMDKSGHVYASEGKPLMDEDFWVVFGKNKAVAWYPPEIARRHWQYSLREV